MYLDQVVETFIELYPYVCHHKPQFLVRYPPEEAVFFIGKKLLAHFYQCLDIPPFLVQANQFFLLDLIVRLILESAVDVTLQVDHIAQGSQGDIT